MKTKLALGVAFLGMSVLLCLIFVFKGKSVGPVGIVVPHHDMVASARAAYLEKVSAHISPKTIILLSPDHFGTNLAPLVASTREWETSVGTVVPDLSLIKALKLPTDSADFKGEHGVTTLLRDIRTYFPSSRLVPIMVSTKTSYEQVERFVTNLYAECPDCLLIASVDFSHTSEADIADLHDVYTERELQQGDAKALFKGAEVDSGACLAALALWADLHKAQRFETFSHTNSGYITSHQVGEMTTHFIGGYSVGKPVTIHDDTVTLQFGGDVMFARGVEEIHTKNPKEALVGILGERFFWGVDAAIVNLEGVFSNDTDYQSYWNDYPPKLRFSPVFISALKEAHISAVSLANNHRFDGGEEEYKFTVNLLKKYTIAPLTNRNGDDPSVQVVTQGDTKVAIMTIATHGEFNDIAPIIEKYTKQDYFVIIFAHWGSEYETEHSPTQEMMAERWIDAGARLVVGSNPHVVQPVGVYKGVPIIYSLGNLLFDQEQSEIVQIGAVLGVKITKEGQELFLVPVSSYLKPVVLDRQYLEWLDAFAGYKNNVKNGNIYYFPGGKANNLDI